MTKVPVASVNTVCGRESGVMTTPSIVTLATPSGEVKVIVPVVVSASPSKAEPSLSPSRGGSCDSSTVVLSPGPGTKSIVLGLSPMAMVSVAVDVSPSPSTRR